MLRAVRPRMQESARHGMRARQKRVYGRAGSACPRCRATIRVRGSGRRQPADLVVPGMPAVSDAGPAGVRRAKRVGHKGAHHLAHGNTLESFERRARASAST